MKKLFSRPHVVCVCVAYCMVLTVLMGCEAKKVDYETLQNAREQECFDDPSRNPPDCLERDSYDEYKQQIRSYPY